MTQTTIDSELLFPAGVWVKTSEAPMCNNPNCCSSTSWVKRSNEKNKNDLNYTGECTNERHNAHCCRAPGNKACSPADWVVLYQQVDPSQEDKLRRIWMKRWLRGLCTLHEAVLEIEGERGSCEVRGWGAAA